MTDDSSTSPRSRFSAAPRYTRQEILRQPLLWPATLEKVRSELERSNSPFNCGNSRVLITGAGTSAYAAGAIATGWSRALAVPTTDLLVDAERNLVDVRAVISLARSGDSPESAAVVELVRSIRPDILQLAIVCNEDGALSHADLDGLIVLDPLTNDNSLVMTSAFSNLVLAGLVLSQPDAVAATMDEFSNRASSLLTDIEQACQQAATRIRERIVVLSSSPLLGWAQEAGLKMLEMTAGRFPVVTDTYLGLRHGPMAFVKPDTLVLCLLSSNPIRRMYEADLLRELRAKKLGYLIGIAEPSESENLFDEIIPAVSSKGDDALRTPYEILGPQLLGYHLSLKIGLNPDNPSPDGVINRVVQGVRVHQPKQPEALSSERR